ncbi:response regulator transcription factor [Myroides sp. LoEW2-1]|uniref:response regulator transcription factor n=1 Tax=Myroides sp. LoEW2-1 TaxID=2683192 RepID=UPI001FB7BCA7|nr:response regulator transcription factor [Myroides sp. LoEW2-1]
MESKKKYHYIIIGILSLLSTVYLYAKVTLSLGLDLFDIQHNTLLLTDNDFQDEAIQLLEDSLPISINFFLSGVFYGIALLGIISTIVIYKIFKIRKWAAIHAIQLLMFCSIIYSDVLVHTTYKITLMVNFMQKGIIISLLFLLSLIASSYVPFSIKRKLYQNEFKFYSFSSVLAIGIYIGHIIITQCHSYYLDLLVITIAIVSQYLMRKLLKRKVYRQYILLLLLLIIFYTICLTDTGVKFSLTQYIDKITTLKILSSIVILLSIFNNYFLIKKYHRRQKKTEMFNSQYVLLVKNYHNLLLKAKGNKSLEIDAIGQSHVQTLSGTQDNLQEREEDPNIRNIYKLTEREINVLELIWEGLTNKEIAAELNISLSTTKYHISNIFIKLNVNSRTQLFTLKAK